jgi:hypothetical protein
METDKPIGPLDKSLLERRMSRRGWFKAVAKTAASAALAYGLTYSAADYVGDSVLGIMDSAEKEIRELGADVNALSGSLERKLSQETNRLKKNYADGRLRILEELGLGSAAEVSEFEQIIANCEDFERHYNFSERARIFRDRIQRRILSLDNALEESQPNFIQRGVNDRIRKLFGMPHGEQGKKYRASMRRRLDQLCKVYDANENNRIAQTGVLDKINGYLENAHDMTAEERELYMFIKDQYSRRGNDANLRDFIRNYDSYDGRKAAMVKLWAYVSEAERLYSEIRKNKHYVMQLQGLLKEGIALKKGVRKESAEEFAKHEKQIASDVDALREEVGGIIGELKDKGYDIGTREEAISKGTFSRGMYGQAVEYIVNAVKHGVAVAAGVLAGAYALIRSVDKKKLNAKDKALVDAVKQHNEVAERYNELRGSR